MKSALSSLELGFVVRELQELIGGKVEQVYQVGKEGFYFQFHVPGKGKRILRIMMGQVAYVASGKGDIPDKPPGFCLFLRRRLKNARLRHVDQLKSERVIEFLFETKEAKYNLIVELFSKGNMILCDDAMTILSVMEQQEWKDRTLRPRQPYTPPAREYGYRDIDRSGLSDMLVKSDKESLVKSLALDLGLGGVYAEELCILSGVEKDLKPAQLSDDEITAVFRSLEGMRERDPAPVVLREKGSEDVKDVVPFRLEYYRGLNEDVKGSYCEALDSVFTEVQEDVELESVQSAADKRKSKVEEMIRQQEQRIAGLERSAADNQRKGELIYENYALVKQVLDEILAMRKTMSWGEVEERLKNNKLIKGIDAKEGEVTVDI